MYHIFIVEDDSSITKIIQTTLEIGGYQSSTCENGKQAVEQILSQPFDLILLDVMLPDMDGFSILEQIRHLDIPVIFLTALQEVTDKVKGLRLGAEDYIVKPFEAMELLARIEVVLRRTHRENTQLSYQNILVNTEQHMVYRNDIPINLTPKEFEVLVFFLKHPNIAITRERLLSSIWGYEYEGETRTVDIHIQQIRKKLGLKDKLVTIPKLGYRLDQ